MGLYVGNKFVIKNGDFIVNEGSTTGIGTTENKKIKASDAGSTDQFGYSVAVGSDRIVVGAPYKDPGIADAGLAYIFDLDGNQLGIITASDPTAGDQFGYSVAVGSGRIVVGSRLDDDNGDNSGSAYIFDLDGNQLGIITASDAAAGDKFGHSVAVGCGKVVVGSYEDDVNSNENQGSVYIYDLDGTNENRITASDPTAGDQFGYSVAVGSGRIVVGSRLDDDNGSASGSAYIFDLDGNQLAKITASDAATADSFGNSVAVGNGRIVVGAPYKDSNGDNSGSAYIFDLDGNQLGIITASDAAADDWFGFSVAVGCGRIVVGAYRDESITGSAYVFDLDGNQLAKINASEGDVGDSFGISVAVGNGRIVVGAHYDYGVGNQEGSAYMWRIDKTLSDYYDDIVDNYRY